MYNQVLPQLWMVLPNDIKLHLVTVFNIKKTGVSEIRDSEVVRDGYTADDLLVISLEKMTNYIGSEETFPRAWELTCMKAKYELSPPPIEMKITSDEVMDALNNSPIEEKDVNTKKSK